MELQKEAALYTELELLDAMVKVVYQFLGSSIQQIESLVNFFSIALGKKKNWDRFLQQQQQRRQVAARFVSERLSGQRVLIGYMEELAVKAKEALDR